MEEGLIYKQIYQYEYPVNGEQPQKTFLGTSEKEMRRCIFCGRGKPEVSFKKEAHVIPAALGNTTLFNYDECDICNEYIFSPYENELMNFLQFERIFIRGKLRRGAPKFKHGNSNSYITSKPGSNQVSIYLDENEHIFEIINDEDNIMKLKCNKPPAYSPVGICKTLVHMAFSVLPEDIRRQFTYIYEWLKGEIKILPLFLDEVCIPGGGMSYVILEIWQTNSKETSSYPLLIRLTYGHKVLSLYLPKDINVANEPTRFNSYRSIPDNCNAVVTSNKIISEDREKLTDYVFEMRYSRKEQMQSEINNE